MPFKDKKKLHEYKLTYQRRWYAKKRENSDWLDNRNQQKKKANHAVRATALRLIEKSKQNEHNYRMRELDKRLGKKKVVELTRASGMRIVYGSRDKNPKFKVRDKYGNIRTEMLFEPFPTW